MGLDSDVTRSKNRISNQKDLSKNGQNQFSHDIYSLKNWWVGEASDAFAREYNNINQDAAKMIKTLDNLESKMSRLASEIRRADEERRREAERRREEERRREAERIAAQKRAADRKKL